MLKGGGKRIGEDLPNVQLWLERMWGLVGKSCDLHVALRFYLSGTTLQDVDEKYDTERARQKFQPWMLSRQDWKAKRDTEGGFAEKYLE